MIQVFLLLALIIIIFVIIKSRKEISVNRKYWIRVFIGLVAGAILLRYGQALFALLAIIVPFILRNFGSISFLANLFQKKQFANKADFNLNENMSKKEAAEILGVNINASENQINAKYKKLMKSLHPDKDGSEYMSKLINKAKDTLLKS